jgi:alpha-mannosidase
MAKIHRTATTGSRRPSGGAWQVMPLPLFRVRDSREWQTVEIERRDDLRASRLSLTVELPGTGWRKRITFPVDEPCVRVEIPCDDPPGVLRLRWGARPGQSQDCRLVARRRWRIHMLHHTHVDIGYTDLPSRVREQQAEILDQVLELCERTREHPEPARFRWINECFWPVTNYLERRDPRRVRDLVRWMRRGAIENTALYMNMTELWTEEMIARSLRHAVQFCAEHRLPLAVGAQTDCPAVSWAVPQLLNQIGIRFLAMSSNSIRAIVPRLPRPFWWTPPSGRVLVWNTDPDHGHYGEGYRHGFRYDYAAVLERLPRVLAAYEDQGYPYPVYGFRLGMDNCYPLEQLSDIVRQWNETWAAPQLRISTFRDFFRELEPLLGRECPVVEGAWPDWWADGHASAASHTARARRLWRRLDGLERVDAMLTPDVDIRDLDEQALEGLLLFDEHTWGARGSAVHPFSPRTLAHWNEKEAPLFHAEDCAEAMAEEIQRGLRYDARQTRLVVANPFLHALSPAVAVAHLGALRRIDFAGGTHPAPPARSAEEWVVTDADTGDELASQPLHPDHVDPQRRGEVAVVIPELGGMCTRRLSARAADGSRIHSRTGLAEATIEAGGYHLSWTQERGITSWRDTVHGREWISAGAALGELLLERPAFNSGEPAEYHHFRASDRSSASRTTGPVFDSLAWTEALEGTGEVAFTARVYHDTPRLELVVGINKLECAAPEALFVAFPFEASRPEFMIDAPGGAYAPEVEQLPGSARDYYHVDAGLALLDDDDWLALASPDAPLFHLQKPRPARWLERLDITTGHVFSNPMLNYWHTNFRPSQAGWVELVYVLTTGRGRPRDRALRSLRESIAGPAVVMGWPRRVFAPVELVEGTVNLLSLRREGDSLWLRLKETTGKAGRCVLRFRQRRGLRVEQTDPYGRDGTPLKVVGGKVQIQFEAYGTVTLSVRAGSGRGKGRGSGAKQRAGA